MRNYWNILVSSTSAPNVPLRGGEGGKWRCTGGATRRNKSIITALARPLQQRLRIRFYLSLREDNKKWRHMVLKMVHNWCHMTPFPFCSDSDGRKATPCGEFVTFAPQTMMVLRIVRVSFVFNVFIFVCERKLDSVLLSGQDEIEEGEEELHSTDKDNNRGNVASTPISKSPMRRYILCRTKLHTLNSALLTGLPFCTISSMLHFTFRALWLQPTLTYTHTSSSLHTATAWYSRIVWPLSFAPEITTCISSWNLSLQEGKRERWFSFCSLLNFYKIY